MRDIEQEELDARMQDYFDRFYGTENAITMKDVRRLAYGLIVSLCGLALLVIALLARWL